MPTSVAIYFSLADLWMVLIPLAAFRIFDVNVGIESRRDLFHLVLFGVILNNVIAAAWGSLSLAMGGVIEWGGVPAAFLLWLIGNAIIIVIIAPLVLHRFTPVVAKSRVFVKNYWF
jgi:integral membrane sensor domain MASE1